MDSLVLVSCDCPTFFVETFVMNLGKGKIRCDEMEIGCGIVIMS